MTSTSLRCRLKADRAEQKWRNEADASWRLLLRAVWTRIRLGSDYDASIRANGEPFIECLGGVALVSNIGNPVSDKPLYPGL